MNEDDRKMFIGERIYTYIEEKYGEHAPKITGMIIDMDPSDLMPTLGSKEALMEKAEEAYNLLTSN